MKTCIVVLFLSIAGISVAVAQTVAFTKVPVSFQLLARDSTDSGTAVISGTVTGTGYDSIVVDVKKGAAAYRHTKAVLSYTGGIAPFSISVKISSELSEYFFKVYGNTQLLSSADSVVCGDVYVFNGQSNMEAGGGSAYDWQLGEWVRSTGYAGSTAVWAKASFDCCFGNWPYANPGANGPQGAGEVAANLGKDLAAAYQTPVLVINGAYSGTIIEQHQPNAANHADTTTLYGRVLRRAQVAGVTNNVKAILYYQGEYTGNNGYTTYAALFDVLYKAWKQDFPAVRKVYIEQINTGCGYASAPNVRDIQRKFQETYNDITVMAACGIREYTGCHYGMGGYAQIAQWWQPVYGRDFYGDQTANTTAPKIISAAYVTGAHLALDLTFDMPVVWPADTLGYSMKDYVTTDTTSGNVDSARVFGSALRLYLHTASTSTTVSYLPYSNYKGTTSTYAGPYLRSARGVGVLTFLNFPILPGASAEAGAVRTGSLSPLSISPNPFTPGTHILVPEYTPGSGIMLKIYSADGRMVADLSGKARLSGAVEWNAAGLPSGIYVLKCVYGNKSLEQKAILAR